MVVRKDYLHNLIERVQELRKQLLTFLNICSNVQKEIRLAGK